ncbi:MAG: prolyl-tRNA synthetase associated domain-containing protein [Geminicoccales bacterium]
MTHTTPEGLHARLDALGIAYETYGHPPLHTVEESKALRGDLPGSHIKNLFLRDKKRQLWLVTVLEDRAIDLKALRQRLGAKGNLSFGSAELLAHALGVPPGAVTPFALINDRERRVRFALDRGVLAEAPVNAHPLTNEATTAVAPDDLLRFAEACGHPPQILDFDRESREE